MTMNNGLKFALKLNNNICLLTNNFQIQNLKLKILTNKFEKKI